MAAAVLVLTLVLGGPQAVAAHSAGIAAQFQLGFSAAGTLLGLLEFLLRAAGTLLNLL